MRLRAVAAHPISAQRDTLRYRHCSQAQEYRSSMPALQPVRGTQDLLPAVARRHRRVSDTARQTAALYGFAEIATPLFEFTEVFSRPIGEHTDIVAKEMYTFTD